VRGHASDVSVAHRPRADAVGFSLAANGNGIIRSHMSDGPAHSSPDPVVRERLLRIVGDILGKSDSVAQLPVEGRLSELGMTSLKMVNLMLAVEVEFELTIPQSDITPDNFRSVGSVEALLMRLLVVKA
jgi:acyl carrier protein